MPTATRVDTLLGAVGITIIARWMARIKGASRRSRGHYSPSALQGHVPLARQVAGTRHTHLIILACKISPRPPIAIVQLEHSLHILWLALALSLHLQDAFVRESFSILHHMT